MGYHSIWDIIIPFQSSSRKKKSNNEQAGNEYKLDMNDA